jgi:Icc-related predicted phosphoesterase
LDLLAGSDFHLGALCHEFERRLDEDALPVFCGDLVNRPRDDADAFERLVARWSSRRSDLVVVPGNHDPEREGPWEGVRVHERGAVRILAIPLIPILYKIPTWTHEVSEATIAARVAPYAGQRYDVVVSHAPPHGLLDRTMGGRHVGSHALRAFAERIEFDVWVCGHVHEGGGRTATLEGRPLYNVARTIRRIPIPNGTASIR